MTVQEGQPPQNPPSVPPPSNEPAQRPWRTEGVPSGQAPTPRAAWTRWALWPVGYLMLFAMFTYQDRMSGPEAVSYTEFKGQVASKNVKEMFARATQSRERSRKPRRCLTSRIARTTSSPRRGPPSPATICSQN